MTDTPKLPAALQEVVDAPMQQLVGPQESYAPLNPKARGAWRFISSEGVPSVVAWTDWKDGFGVLTVSDGDIATKLSNYVLTCKALDLEAGWAYTTLSSYIENLPDCVLGPQFRGTLDGVWEAAGGNTSTGEEETDDAD